MFEVVWSPAGHMTVEWADGRVDHKRASRAKAETFAFERGLRLCHVTDGGGLCMRAMTDCH